MTVKEILRKGYRLGMRAVRAKKFTLTKGTYWDWANGKPCGCAAGMIAYGLGMRTNWPDTACTFLVGKGVSEDTRMETSDLFEHTHGIKAGLKRVRKFLAKRVVRRA